jgi:hypothetical protein
MAIKQVNQLKVGDRVKTERGGVVYVRSIESNRVRVSKQPFGLCVMSIAFHTHRFADLLNRAEVVA